MILLLIDEASRVEDAMYKALRPMLAVAQGDLWLMSTPLRQARIFLRVLGARARGRVVPDERAGDGVRADFGRSFWSRSGGRSGRSGSRRSIWAEFVDNGAAVFGRDLVEAGGG